MAHGGQRIEFCCHAPRDGSGVEMPQGCSIRPAPPVTRASVTPALFARRVRRYFGLGLALAVTTLAALAAAGAQTLEGPRLFQRCYACHSLDPAERGLSGPNLRGLFGRRAGTLEGFDYSPALRRAGARGLLWTEETLDRFLDDPEEFVPGARMGGVWLRDPAERRALIQWLKEAAR